MKLLDLNEPIQLIKGVKIPLKNSFFALLLLVMMENIHRAEVKTVVRVLFVVNDKIVSYENINH